MNLRPQTSLTLPATDAYPIEGKRGMECAMLAVSREPLTREQIEMLDHTPLILGTRLDAKDEFQVVQSEASGAAAPIEDRERGLGKPQPVRITVRDTNIAKVLDRLSMRYCGFLMPHQ